MLCPMSLGMKTEKFSLGKDSPTSPPPPHPPSGKHLHVQYNPDTGPELSKLAWWVRGPMHNIDPRSLNQQSNDDHAGVYKYHMGHLIQRH